MGALDFSGLPPQALLLVDSAPIIYVLDRHPELGPRFRPLFEAQEADTVRLAITSVTIIEVLTGALAAGDQVQARRYRKVFESWTVVGLDQAIAERAAEWRASLRLKLADSIQLASAFAINADALVTHDRDFSRVKGMRVIR